MRDSFDSFISSSWSINQIIDLDNLGGRIVQNLLLHARSEPYMIRSDITVMPEATLHIYPDVVMEFAPNVGILVLGTLKAIGASGHEIIMRPMKRVDASVNSTFVKLAPMKRASPNLASMSDETIRLCKDGRCSATNSEGEPKNINIFTQRIDAHHFVRYTDSLPYFICFYLILLIFFWISQLDFTGFGIIFFYRI